jgi:hypothetical protein
VWNQAVQSLILVFSQQKKIPPVVTLNFIERSNSTLKILKGFDDGV